MINRKKSKGGASTSSNIYLISSIMRMAPVQSEKNGSIVIVPSGENPSMGIRVLCTLKS